MDYEFERHGTADIAAGEKQPRYDRLVMRAGRFFLEGTLPTGEAFSVQLGPSDPSTEPPAH